MTALRPAAVALHLGQLHPHEQLLVLAVAFGPFLVLAVVVLVLRRRDGATHPGAAGRGETPPDPVGRGDGRDRS